MSSGAPTEVTVLRTDPVVVAAFVGPDNSRWYGRMVNVTSDGAWWTWNDHTRQWDADIPPLPARTAVEPETPASSEGGG